MDDRPQFASNPRCLLRLPEVLHRTGLSRSTLYKRIAEGAFPRPVSLGARMVAWDSWAVDAWIEAKIAATAQTL